MMFEKSILMDIVYGYEPMTRQLAEKIKNLRCDQKLPYEHIPYHLNEGFGGDFSLGKDLCLKAQQSLKDTNESWG
ncbi:MAG: hypothetical protein JWQ04_357 [Pedosphaera sp.]|nr:hypothetical protein [Pedosphaera sp.]